MKALFRSSLILMLAGGLLAGCERPPVDAVQRGYRGTGMEQVYNPRTVALQMANNQPPAAQPAAAPVAGGPTAGQVFQNVKVLGSLGVGEFSRLMLAMTAWVAPNQGCTYCHAADNMAADTLYTKVVARRMLEMTRQINTEWQPHVAQTGVTCYTCHRGQPVPAKVWFAPQPQRQATLTAGNDALQNKPAPASALASLPYDPYTPFLLQANEIRIAGTTALPAGNLNSIKKTEFTYGLMMHMSDALGVNCTYCHNTASFSNWGMGAPQRVTAWHGIRMTRDLNNNFLTPLTATFPKARLGPTGDVAKVNCATCHQGAFKPLYGAPLVKDHPELVAAAAPAPAPEPAAPAAPAKKK
ncbi:MAG: photosynthetic reaction center cytochrome PufC [Rhodoferax sp.]